MAPLVLRRGRACYGEFKKDHLGPQSYDQHA
jgi:hypothetical protein